MRRTTTLVSLMFAFLVIVPLVLASAHGAFAAESRDGAVAEASLRIHAGRQAAHPVPRYITGKFCEHLGRNIYQGMDAQVLRNPTFADYPFYNGQMTPDGITAFHGDRELIASQLRREAERLGWPASELDRLVESRQDALACWWVREGARDAVQLSPDTGPHGGRAQRIQVRRAGEGIAQWTWLPLHRTRKYEFEVLARSPDLDSLSVVLWANRPEPPKDQPGGNQAIRPCAEATVRGLSRQWKTLRGTLEVDAQSPADAIYRLGILAGSPGQFVIARMLLRPADHVDGADPDVVRLLKESRLPLLRWPGGNFVSAYHWEDGIGPVDARPTRPNYAWGGVEPNLFGTDEFMAFCRAVGCEPMICVNAGNGTPEEAGRWIEYCNGPADSPLGKRRAANGHPAPYNVRHWEIGNELWGRWQCHWTTAAGYVDRYEQFRKAMLAADPTVRLYSCGAPAMSDREWNATLIRGVGPSLVTITDHPLIGGSVATSVDPLDVFRDFMAVPDVLAGRWGALQRDMAAAGIREPRLAVTELQLFARLAGPGPHDKERLNQRNLVTPATLAEALYDVLIYHRAVRLAPFVEMVTHSATVNHGGGLRKERERVYANPCHWAQAGFAEFAGARPVALEAASPKETAPRVLPPMKDAAPQCSFEMIDALAALAPDGALLVSIVHRGSRGPVRVAVQLDGFAAGPKAELRLLTADVPWAANSLQSPEAVRPVDSAVEVRDGKATLELKPYTWARLRLAKAAK